MSALDLTIAVCTADRPDTLSRLLADLERATAGTWTHEVLVVDNGAAPIEVDAAVGSFRANGAGGHLQVASPRSFARNERASAESAAIAVQARVVTSPRHNIARARNVALAEARGRLLLWLDDDQRVGPTFFVDLERAWQHRPAWSRGVRLAVRPAFDGPVEARVVTFFAPQIGLEGGAVRRATFATNGLLVETQALRSIAGPTAEGPFDPWFGTRGAEDTDLFLRALDAGLRFSSTRLVWVEEVVPAARARLFYMMRHAFRIGFTDTKIDLARTSRREVFADLLAHLAFEATFLPISMRTPQGRMHRGLSLVRQAGKVWALAGRDYEHYK